MAKTHYLPLFGVIKGHEKQTSIGLSIQEIYSKQIIHMINKWHIKEATQLLIQLIYFIDLTDLIN